MIFRRLSNARAARASQSSVLICGVFWSRAVLSPVGREEAVEQDGDGDLQQRPVDHDHVAASEKEWRMGREREREGKTKG